MYLCFNIISNTVCLFWFHLIYFYKKKNKLAPNNVMFSIYILTIAMSWNENFDRLERGWQNKMHFQKVENKNLTKCEWQHRYNAPNSNSVYKTVKNNKYFYMKSWTHKNDWCIAHLQSTMCQARIWQNKRLFFGGIIEIMVY